MNADAYGPRPSDPNFRERRKVPRYPLKLPIELLEPIKSLRSVAHTRDVSLSGCCVADANPLHLDTIIHLHIWHGQESVELWARVVRISDSQTMGLVFLKIQPEQESILVRWIGEGVTATNRNLSGRPEITALLSYGFSNAEIQYVREKSEQFRREIQAHGENRWTPYNSLMSRVR